MEKKKLILVDGYSFFFRAYYALKNIKKRSDGLAVNGIYGFTKMLINLIVDLKSTHIAVVFDTGKKTFRHEIFQDYKANRPPVPDDMIPQFTILREVTDVLNIKTIEKDGYEADDIIATITKQAEKDGYEVWIVSGDKDLMQLVDENVFLYDTKENKKIGIIDVQEKWGVRPKQLGDVLSLMGDHADNVPGVPSIGEKTAIELVNTFGSIDNMLQHLDEITPLRRRNTIMDNLDKLELSKELVKLADDVDLNLTIDDLKFKNFDPYKFRDFLYKMEFNSIAREMEKAFNLDINKTTDSNDLKYKKITTLNDLKNIIKVKDKFFFEILTVNENISAISFYQDSFIFYIYVNDENDLMNTSDIKTHDVLNVLKNIFENSNILKISYDIKKTIKILKGYDINLVNYDDIKVMSYILDNGKHNHNLDDIITAYLYKNVEIKINSLEKYNLLIKDYEDGKNNNVDFETACFRVNAINILYNLLNERLLENKELFKLYTEIEKPIVSILANMEFLGVKVDVITLKQLSDYFLKEVSKIENEIYKISGTTFNLNSPKQLSEILFEKMGLPKITKPSKSGIYSTDVDTMETLYQMGFEVAGKILEYRHYTKLRNTYTDTLQKLVDKNSRVHTTYENTYVITGRLASSNPNLQNIPIRTEDGEKIRKAFIAKEGYSFIGVDYSQIELRILAEYANVKKLKENFKNNLDIHSETAKTVFNTDTITPEMRRMAKAINFSIVYGTTSYGLAKRLDKSNNEAKQYMDNYFQLYPEIRKYMEDIKDFVKKNGYIKTMFNRICYISISSGVQKGFQERLAINAPIQGTGADIIKMAMIKVNEAIKKYDANIILQIHDELLIEVKDEQLEEVKSVVKREMENVVNFSIALPIEIKSGKNWGEVH